MALVTLSGTISAADLNNNFNDKTSTIRSNFLLGQKDQQYDLEIFDLVTSTSVGARTLDFTPPDDLEFRVLGYALEAASAVPIVTVTLAAIDIDGNDAPVYMLDQTISISKAAAVGEAQATRTDKQASTTSKLFLKKGVTYRLQASSDSATNVDRCHIFLLLRSRRRKS